MLFNVVPLFIIWKIWKRRNTINHGGRMRHVGIEIEIDRNLFLLAKYNYPWRKDLPTSWPGLIKFIKEYTPTLGCRRIVWNPPVMGSFKYNSDGASKRNPGPSYGAYNILDGIWETLWGIMMKIKRIKMLMEDKEVIAEHILKEGNQLANFLTNHIFYFVGTQTLTYSNFQDLPTNARGIINTEKEKLPSLRIRRYQN
ncbi:hypothetical protein H5410_030808 [Solanum commersonii]|uniref:RNase H type-1 domain-containing protein n=1 Tax=Solanum commersonii TaxID=4109 RepID=A0A9J5YKF8_SOLCO|nr:hypothetical protein H5410_030808 [Solanum commersonii]